MKMAIDFHLQSIQGNVANAASQLALFGANGGAATVAPGPVATITLPVVATGRGMALMRRPVVHSGGAMRAVATMRAAGATTGRAFYMGFTSGPSDTARDSLLFGIKDRKLTLTYVNNYNGTNVVDITREEHFARVLKAFNPDIPHTYELTFSPSGFVMLCVDGQVVYRAASAPGRVPHNRYWHPVVMAQNNTVQSAVGSFEVYSFDVYSERRPASLLRNVQSTFPAGAAAQIVNHLFNPVAAVRPSWAEIVRISVMAGTNPLRYSAGLGLTAGAAPAGTVVPLAGQKLATIAAGAVDNQNLETLARGIVLPTQGMKTIWERGRDGAALIYKNEAMASGLVNEGHVALSASLHALAAGGTAALSVDYLVQ